MRQVTILFMEEDAAFAAVRAGQVDVAYTAASYADQSVPEFSLLDCETVDNRGFNLPAVPETVREDGVKSAMILPRMCRCAGRSTWRLTGRK